VPGAAAFNDNIDSWQMTSVTTMWQMFRGAANFNQNINSWRTGSVMSMTEMFASAESFNQPLDSWQTASTTDLSGMFHTALRFNQTLDAWQVFFLTRKEASNKGGTAAISISLGPLHVRPRPPCGEPNEINELPTPGFHFIGTGVHVFFQADGVGHGFFEHV